MSNLPISRKLILCFGIILLVFVGLGALSMLKLHDLADTAQELGVDRRAKLEAAATINTAASDVRVAEAYDVMARDPASISSAERAIMDQRELIKKTLDWLEPRVSIPAMRAAMESFKSEKASYERDSDRVVALVRQGRSDEALAAFRANKASYNVMNNAAVALQAAQSKVMDERAKAAEDVYRGARLIIAIAVIGVIAFCVGMLVMLVKGIAHPVKAATQAISALAKGDMSVKMNVSDRADEVGELGRAMEGLRGQLAAAEQAKAEQAQLIVTSIGSGLEALSRGDLTYRVTAELEGVFAQLKSDYNGALEALATTMAAFTEAASGINSGSVEIRQASEDLSNRTEQQAASLEETAAALSQVTTTVRSAAEDAQRASRVVEAARGDAEQSGHVVKRAVEAMEGIERTAREINDIISVIDGIAFQTNLLALNAGVEAARAGDAGKGFAVVASEVRALAERSAEAAKDIKAKITASGEQVASGVDLVTETGKALGRIVASVGEISGLMGQIATSAEVQSAGLTQVNTAVSEMDSMTQQNAAMAEQATAAARSLAGQADQLAAEVSRFRIGNAHGTTEARPPVVVPLRRSAPAQPATARARITAAGGRASLSAAADDDWTEF
ncbi:methyl-accepting chemotaxis protein [Sphingomonas morindae]|uniref:Methyl-accepting chemotaxis protein n=1 Tax=Sphingomonas morindae TaxID=1541170 RepID=A0ABY4X9B5_9SPHN|nr:methyl-accepting chemotaxis protein [Sphingomonas morindae]USI73531.1 methyl-accepting chemotaxis protein [Sphingomonas morindae]